MNHKFYIRLILCVILILGVTSFALAQNNNGDRDGDGVGDSRDRCPSQPGPASTYGCPVEDNDDGGNRGGDGGSDKSGGSNNGDSGSQPPPPDSDGDGTADPQDRCPNLPGDGANYGCPPGMTSEDNNENDDTGTSPEPENPPFVLVPIPEDEPCAVMPAGNYRVLIREHPDPSAPVVGVLNPNIPASIDSVIWTDTSVPSELEPEGDKLGPWFAPTPDDDTPPGWVAGTVVSWGGDDCEDFEPTSDRREPYLKFKLENTVITSYQVSGSGQAGDTNHDKWVIIESYDWSAMHIEINALLGNEEEARGDTVPVDTMSLNFDKITFQYSMVGDHILELKGVDGESQESSSQNNSDGSTTIEYCVYQEVHEVGVFEEVCYEIEVPENCTVTSPEAGIYDIDCDGRTTVEINPLLDGLPAADLTFNPDTNQPVFAGLLLPNVTPIRAAGRD